MSTVAKWTPLSLARASSASGAVDADSVPVSQQREEADEQGRGPGGAPDDGGDDDSDDDSDDDGGGG
eukprot:2396912-Prymnesium_polylepis.1